MPKEVRLSSHATGRAAQRGALAEELAATVRESPWRPDGRGRQQATRDFVYDAQWHGRHYATEWVRGVFVEQSGNVTVITVSVYFLNEKGSGCG